MYVIQAFNLPKLDLFNGLSDGFVELKFNMGTKQTYNTKTIDDNCNPLWEY